MSSISAQNEIIANRIKSNKIYTIWIDSKSGKDIKGDLYRTYDDSIIISKQNFTYFKTYSIQNINKIQLRNKYKKTGGVIMGSLAGLFMGILIGESKNKSKSSTSSEPKFFENLSKDINTFGSGVVGMISGGIVGGLIGSIKIAIPINGDKNQYNSVKDKLKSISKVK